MKSTTRRVILMSLILLAPTILTPVVSAQPNALGLTAPGWIQGGIKNACDGLDWLTSKTFGCERAAPIVGTGLAVGACLAATAATVGLAAVPCAAGAAVSFGIGAGVSEVFNGGCSGSMTAGVGAFYDDCLTAGWGATKNAVSDARRGEADAWDAGGVALDFIGSALPVTGIGGITQLGKTGAKAIGKGGFQVTLDVATDAGKAASSASKAKSVATAAAGGAGFWQSAGRALKGGTSAGAKQIVQYGDDVARNAFSKVSKVGSAGARTAARLQGAGKFAAGWGVKGAGKALERTWFRAGLKTGVPAASAVFVNPAVNALKTTSVDQPPTNSGDGTTPRAEDIMIEWIQPEDGEIFAPGEAVPLSFVIHAQAMTSWSLWVTPAGGKPVELAGNTPPQPASGPLQYDASKTFPPGAYTLTAHARYTSTQYGRASINISVTDDSGNVPTPEEAPGQCSMDLNHDGQKDCVEVFSGTFDRRVGTPPNTVAVVAGLLVVVGTILYVTYVALRRE